MKQVNTNSASSVHKSMHERPTVLVVDDDPRVLKAVRSLLRAARFDTRTFARPTLLLASELPSTNACLLIDLCLPEMDGIELQERLVAAGCRLPVILMTGRSDAQTGPRLQQAKAVAVLPKPFTEGLLLDTIARALELRHPPGP